MVGSPADRAALSVAYVSSAGKGGTQTACYIFFLNLLLFTLYVFGVLPFIRPPPLLNLDPFLSFQVGYALPADGHSTSKLGMPWNST